MGLASSLFSVRMLSLFGSLVSSGLASKLMVAALTAPATASTAKTSRTGRRRRCSARSICAPNGRPTGSASAPGRNSQSSAGKKVMVQKKAMNMPAPAMTPSSATPTKGVGAKAKKPQAVAVAASAICPPAWRPVSGIARARSVRPCRTSRRRTQNWMAKSTARPMNRIAKATEIRLMTPMNTAAKLIVSARPSSRVARIGTISRQERSARNSHSAISSTLMMPPTTSPWVSEANCSSDKRDLTGIIDRGAAGLARPAGFSAIRTSAAVATPPGSNVPLIELRMRQHEFGVLRADIAGDQALPGERHRMAGGGGGKVVSHALQRALIGRQIGPAWRRPARSGPGR